METGVAFQIWSPEKDRSRRVRRETAWFNRVMQEWRLRSVSESSVRLREACREASCSKGQERWIYVVKRSSVSIG